MNILVASTPSEAAPDFVRRRVLTRPAPDVSCQRMGTRHTKKSKRDFADTFIAYRARRARELGQPFSQAAAALELGISKRTLQNWEIARTRPHGAYLQFILQRIAPPPPAKAKRRA